MLRIAVLVSGGGTNLQALIDSQKSGDIKNGEIKLVLSSNHKAFALERAKKENIKTQVLIRKDFGTMDEYSDALISILKENQIDLVVLAGFMTIISEKVTKAFENKIMNVHPSLIPAFCGEGFYGLHVHEAVLKKGVKVSGATVHFVNEECDGGPIILQQPVAVENDDTPEILQKRIMEQAEWNILPKAVSLFCQGKIQVKDNKTYIN